MKFRAYSCNSWLNSFPFHLTLAVKVISLFFGG